jgi:uncharacterized protein
VAQFYADRVAIGSHRAKTPEGYLVLLGIPIARTGIQKYKASELKLEGVPANQTVEVYRPYDEVFSPATVASFEGKSITSPHPPVFLTPDNDSTYSRGHGQNLRKGDEVLEDGEFGLLADLVVKDGVLASRVDNNTISEISCGYDYDLVPDDSVPGRYKQVNIRGNHIAIVESGRAGSSVRVLDSSSPEATPEREEGITMDVKEATGFFTGMKDFFSSLGLRLVAQDSTPDDPVKRNEEVNAEALRRAARRNEDSKVKAKDGDPAEKELENEEKGAKDPEKSEEKGAHDKKHAKDDDDDKKSKAKDDDDDDKKHKSMDAVDRLCGLVEKLIARDAKRKDDDEEKCNCGAKGEEAHDDDCPKHRAADDELIPVETLEKSQIPHNPIPGADAKKALDAMIALKPFIAASGNRQAIDTWNEQYKALRGPGKSKGGYDAVLSARDKDREGKMDQHRVRSGDASDAGDALTKTAATFLGRDIAEVAEEARKKSNTKEVIN